MIIKISPFHLSDYGSSTSGTTILPLIMFLAWICASHSSGAIKFRYKKITSLIAHSTIRYLASSQEWMNHWFKNKQYYLFHSHGQAAFLNFYEVIKVKKNLYSQTTFSSKCAVRQHSAVKPTEKQVPPSYSQHFNMKVRMQTKEISVIIYQRLRLLQ